MVRGWFLAEGYHQKAIGAMYVRYPDRAKDRSERTLINRKDKADA